MLREGRKSVSFRPIRRSSKMGGPLYFGDKVIGVNTWKVVAVEIGGLNFAVHYAEVLEFLEANGIATGG